MYDDFTDLKETLPFSIKDAPKCMHPYDLRVLSPEEQKQLNNLKIQTVRENHQYLKEHPEIKFIIMSLIKAVIADNVHDDEVAEYASMFFQENQGILEEEVREFLEQEKSIQKGSSILSSTLSSSTESKVDVSISANLDIFSDKKSELSMEPEVMSFLSASCICEDAEIEDDLKVCRSCFADAEKLISKRKSDLHESEVMELEIEAEEIDNEKLTLLDLREGADVLEDTASAEIEQDILITVPSVAMQESVKIFGKGVDYDESNKITTVDNLRSLEDMLQKGDIAVVDTDKHFTTPVSVRSERLTYEDQFY